MKVKLAKIKHVYFISVSARMYICCGIHKWFANCDLRATGELYVLGGPVANYKYILKISLNLCSKFIF